MNDYIKDVDDYIKHVIYNSKSVTHDTLKKEYICSDMNIVCTIVKKYTKSSFIILEEKDTIKIIYVHAPSNRSEGVIASCNVNYII